MDTEYQENTLKTGEFQAGTWELAHLSADFCLLCPAGYLIAKITLLGKEWL